MDADDIDLVRTWLFGPGADAAAHEAMALSGADALILDLEDFTPSARRGAARRALPAVLERWRKAGCVTVVRINALDADGPLDLGAAMPARPEVIAYPMAQSVEQVRALDAALARWETKLRMAPGATAILPVCETSLGVVEVRAMAKGSARVRAALLGAEDLAADLCAERQPDALGYRCKSLVRPEHAQPINAALTPSDEELRRATVMVESFEAARARGEDRALVEGLWVEVPTYRNARRLIERGRRLRLAR